MKKVRLALIGAGVIGKRHLRAAGAINEIELVAIADPFPCLKPASLMVS